MNPKVSILMPAYNADKYIRESINSILKQTFQDWELIVINDSSTDNTAEILATFEDPRIRIYTNEKNLGSVGSRNKAFDLSRGEYIAILDADDIAMPARLEEQNQFLDTHPNFGLVGTISKTIGENGQQIGRVVKNLVPSEKMSATLLFHNIMAFSSVMMRKSAMPKIPFDQNSVPVEDVDLYLKMVDSWQFAILPKVLISYRAHEKGISKVFNTKRQEVMNRLITQQLKKLDIIPTDENLKIHRTNYSYAGNDTKQFLEKREQWLRQLIEQNKKTKIYPDELFEEIVSEKWLESCDANARLGFSLWKIFKSSPLSKRIKWTLYPKKLLRLAIKCSISKDKI